MNFPGGGQQILTMWRQRWPACGGQVGLSDISNFAKYRVTGEGATAWLDQMLACTLPRAGRMTLAPMLKDDGRVIGDFSVACLDEGSYLLIGSGLAEDYHMRWFLSHLPDDGSVTVTSEGLGLCGLTIAGPNAGLFWPA